MELKKAIGVLETHNRWRRGEDIEPKLKPSDIGVAIDVVVEYIKNNSVLDDVIKCDCEDKNYALIEITENLCLECNKPIK